MPFRKALRRPLVLAAALTLLACDRPADIRIWEMERVPEGLRLEVGVTPRQLVPGDTARIEVSLTNTRSARVTLHFGSSCQLGYDILNSAGNSVRPGTGCLAVMTELELAAGATHTVTFAWTGERSRYPHPGMEPLPPDEYRVIGTLGAGSELRSTEATLELLEPAP